ncbi:MAG: class I SAM-dependent methyltransferase [Umezawaea sp.]
MVDSFFDDPELAALYDTFSGWEGRGDFAFHLTLIMAADSVLDVGCGTGTLLHGARRAGHRGRLCGLDPAVGMLAEAREHPDVDWVHGDLSTTSWDREFDLVVMTGHAFQVLVTDAELRQALGAVERALTPGGRFAFETRNPAARAWERWTSIDGADGVSRVEYVVEPPERDLVTFTHTFHSPRLDGPRTSRSTLRFLDVDGLAGFLAGAGLAVVEQYGDWDRSPVAEASPEIITVAGRLAG